MRKVSATVFAGFVLCAAAVWGAYESSPDLKKILSERVDHYRKTAKFKDSVLSAVSNVPRDFFVPAEKIKQTYDEVNIPIGFGQTLTNMWFVSHMTNLLDLKPGDKVLEIGSGSGYQASVLYQITKDVYSIEIVEQLSAKASARWKALGYSKIKGKAADGYFGWQEHAPFDKIVVTCAADHIPTYLLQQLKPNGIMVIPVGNPFDCQTLLVVKKGADGKITTQRLNNCKFVPFTGKMLEKFSKK